MTPRMPGIRLGILLCLVLLPGHARAHGGEDHAHADDKPAAVAARPDTISGRSARFEVLVKHAPARPGQPLALRVFVADAASNAPVAGARVQLGLAGPTQAEVLAAATAQPGIYAGAVTLPALGDYQAVAGVAAAGAVEVVPLGALHVGEPPPVPLPPHEHPPSPWLFATVTLAVLLLALLIRAALGRRRQVREAGHA